MCLSGARESSLSADAVASSLTRLYSSYGYSKFKMSKFEEYDLYAQNRDFLSDGGILTFTDLNGRLMALKPDITLSIVKNAKDARKRPYKLYYNESVYRTVRGSRDFKEITQVGLELIGEIDRYSSLEVVSLAARSLAMLSDKTVLDISHLGIVSGALDIAGLTQPEQRERASELLSARSAKELKAFCLSNGSSEESAQMLEGIAGLYGDFGTAVAQLRRLCPSGACLSALEELEDVYCLLLATGLGENVMLDLTIGGGQGYYNGIIFRGFVEGVPSAVISGGRYDMLLGKFGIDAQAFGFAVYLDVIEEYMQCTGEYDADVLLTYGGCSDAALISGEAKKLIDNGLSVRVQREDNGSVRYKRLIDIKECVPDA